MLGIYRPSSKHQNKNFYVYKLSNIGYHIKRDEKAVLALNKWILERVDRQWLR